MTDWPALLPDVARRLLGDPPRTEHGGATWRYGNHGSMAVHVGGDRRGLWHDFEADRSGGTLTLVQHALQTDRAGALRWLESERLLPARDGDRPVALRAPVSQPKPTARKSSKTAPLAAAILAASVPADDTPARAYLATRWTWPPLGIGPDLPAAVRWCDARAIPPDAYLPAVAAGVVVYRRTRPDVQHDDAPAVALEALTAASELLAPRWRRTFGAGTGRVFEVPVAAGNALVLVEGERDALAVALTLRAGCVRSVGGTAGYRPAAAADPADRPVVLLPDAEHTGVAAVTRLLLPGALPGRVVRVVRAADGDPADWLAAWLTERAGIREHDGGDDRGAATAAAWRDLLAAVERGTPILIDLEPTCD